jgi:REP element-mobilizing transposase RayT
MANEPRRDSGFSPVRGRSELPRPVRRGRPRLTSFDYTGHYAYHITIRTATSRPVFADLDLGRSCAGALMELAAKHGFTVIAFCLMPDHIHLLAQGETDGANLKAFISAFKQRTGFQYKKATGRPLWQVSYFDRALRRGEDLQTVADYVFSNPVKDGLVEDATHYALSGGAFFTGATTDRAEATGPTSVDPSVDTVGATVPTRVSAPLNQPGAIS